MERSSHASAGSAPYSTLIGTQAGVQIAQAFVLWRIYLPGGRPR